MYWGLHGSQKAIGEDIWELLRTRVRAYVHALSTPFSRGKIVLTHVHLLIPNDVVSGNESVNQPQLTPGI